MVGIITNNSALQAQKNLETSNTQAERSISRLSSGNRIIKAKDDVAGLAVGTILKTNVSTMRAALTNSAQAASLLGLADGALENVGQILQRQKVLASQATSGSLDETARGFLNQEFQNLTAEVDRISNATNFNGIKLIDGGLFNASKVTTDTRQNAKPVSGVLTLKTNFSNNDTLRFLNATGAPEGSRGATFTAYTNGGSPSKAYPASLYQFEIGANVTETMTNIMNMFENLRKYKGSDVNANIARRAASLFKFEQDGNNITMTSYATGSAWNFASIQTTGLGTNDITFNGIGVGNAFKTFQDLGVTGVDGALSSGHLPDGAGSTAYKQSNNAGAAKQLPSVYVQGNVSGNLVLPINNNFAINTGIAVANISNNPAFIGKLPTITATHVGDDAVDLELTVGDITYKATHVNTDVAAAGRSPIATFRPEETGYGVFEVQFDVNGLTVNSQEDADIFAIRLNKSFDTIDLYQRRRLTNYSPAGTVYATGSTAASGDLSGSQVYLINNDFDNVVIEDVRVTAPPTGSTEATIEIIINGEVYKSGYDYDGSVEALGNTMTSAGNGNRAFTDSEGVNHAGTYGFVNQSNPSKMIHFNYTSGTAMQITNTAQAEGVEKALKDAFGINSDQGIGLSFQVGTRADDAIDVQIMSTKTEDLFQDHLGATKTLDISTEQGAKEAGVILDSAIATVTSVRAQVGSLQSRFDVAQASIKSSIENLDASRSVFLDADISAESTELAQAQVRLQASISVLAQANQLSQTFLALLS